jgi:hypothetical protein
MSFKELSQECAKQWKTIDPKKKAEYQAAYDKEKAEFDRKYKK